MPRTKKVDANAPATNTTRKTNNTSSSTSKQPTAAEMKEFYEKNKQAIHDIVLLLAAVLGCCLFFRYLFQDISIIVLRYISDLLHIMPICSVWMQEL